MDDYADRACSNCLKLVSFAISSSHYRCSLSDLCMVVHLFVYLPQGMVVFFLDFSSSLWCLVLTTINVLNLKYHTQKSAKIFLYVAEHACMWYGSVDFWILWREFIQCKYILLYLVERQDLVKFLKLAFGCWEFVSFSCFIF